MVKEAFTSGIQREIDYLNLRKAKLFDELDTIIDRRNQLQEESDVIQN